MHVNRTNYFRIVKDIETVEGSLVAVSKIKPVEAILELYELGHRDFGENYVQELVDKQSRLPPDIRWHFIGHLQTNKVKYIAPFIHLVHGVDSGKLLKEINKQGAKNNRIINVLLQVHIASEETKFGFDENDLNELIHTNAEDLQKLKNIKITGLMGMASFSDDDSVVRGEFQNLKRLFDRYVPLHTENCKLEILSMGMSGDYKIALENGSNMVRIGSLLFGGR